jgi:hypothetical protein
MLTCLSSIVERDWTVMGQLTHLASQELPLAKGQQPPPG